MSVLIELLEWLLKGKTKDIVMLLTLIDPIFQCHSEERLRGPCLRHFPALIQNERLNTRYQQVVD